MEYLKTLCFTLCIGSIAGSVLLGMLLIWSEVLNSQIAWKCLATLGVVFFGSAATLVVSRHVDP